MKVLSDEETSRLNKTMAKKDSPERVYNRIELHDQDARASLLSKCCIRQTALNIPEDEL